MNLNDVITKAIYDTLVSDSTLLALVTDNNSDTVANKGVKIWYGSAPSRLETAFPYVLMTYSFGGIQNDAPYESADITFMITGIDKTRPGTKAIAALIDENLRHKNITYSDGWHSWATVRQINQFSRVENVVNSPYYQEGAYYRFRLSKGL